MPNSEALYQQVGKDYDAAVAYNSKINLYDTVEANENFYIGKQWEGVTSNGLPTPVFNFLKRVVPFAVSSVTTDNLKLQASPLPGTSAYAIRVVEQFAEVINQQFESIVEANSLVTLIREYMRNSAVDGDGCMHTYFNPDIETGQSAKGAICTEIVENTRVFFGNPNNREVQRQPYIIISSRQDVKETQERAKENGSSTWDAVKSDTETGENQSVSSGDKATVLLRYRRDKKTKTIWAYECTKDAEIRAEWDTGLKLYPITWTPWDYIQDCYHGQAMVTGLIPNQIFVNKMFAMTQISLMTSAYPKIVYDKTRVAKWDNRVGAAIGINGGDVTNVAKIIDPAQISPQISQFIDMTVGMTQELLGATSAALGNTRPDNTSAIIALQRASSVPMEIQKDNLHKAIEDLGRIYIDFMRAYYGLRFVDVAIDPARPAPQVFDFKSLNAMPLSVKLDVGASAYWSEIASVQTLDNLLMQNKITTAQYLERVPSGYIPKKQELINEIKAMLQMGIPPEAQQSGDGAIAAPMDTQNMPLPDTTGNAQLQRAIVKTGAA